MRKHPLRGAIFESWVASEMLKSRVHPGLPPALTFFRDRKGAEVDLVVERAGAFTAVETKSGQTVASDFFSGLDALTSLATTARPPRKIEGFVVYGGDESQHRSATTVLSWKELDRRSWCEKG